MPVLPALQHAPPALPGLRRLPTLPNRIQKSCLTSSHSTMGDLVRLALILIQRQPASKTAASKRTWPCSAYSGRAHTSKAPGGCPTPHGPPGPTWPRPNRHATHTQIPCMPSLQEPMKTSRGHMLRPSALFQRHAEPPAPSRPWVMLQVTIPARDPYTDRHKLRQGSAASHCACRCSSRSPSAAGDRG